MNQLIQYVNDCLKYSESAKEAAAYVQDQLFRVDEYTQFILEGLTDFEDKYIDSLEKYATLNNLYVGMEVIQESIMKYDADVTKYAKEAYDSSEDAKAWAYLAYVIFLDGRELLDHKGDFTITSGGMFPSIPTKDSIWNVKTNGQEDVGLMGFVWNEGDQLTYTLREKKFNQIKKDFYDFK
ncbi:MAG: hypothetical protein ACRCZ2_03890 [Fusobacteriaceae bacterium]